MPDISYSQISMKPLYRKIPRLEKLHLSSVLNSFVKCRVCRGQRIVAIKSDTLKTFRYTKCPFCKGTSVMSNRESYYEHWGTGKITR